MALGCGEYTAYLYDRGGRQRIQQFEAIVEGNFQRVKSDISSAYITVSSQRCGCDWLGQMRSMRHELVIYRDTDRVWEGPITRIEYGQDLVTVNAKDVLFYLARRVNQSRFHTGNIVNEAQSILHDALRYDDPNVWQFRATYPSGGLAYTCAWNRADNYYFDCLQDMSEAGLAFTTVGRKVVFWADGRRIGQTVLLRSPQDLGAPVTVVDDGMSLATKFYRTGEDTFGAAGGFGIDRNGQMPNPTGRVVSEPAVVNLSTNPSLEATTQGFAGSATHPKIVNGYDATAGFTVSRGLAGGAPWASGAYVGRLTSNPPLKPAAIRKRPQSPHLGKKGSDTDAQWQARQDKYHQAKDNYENDLKNWEKDRKVSSKVTKAYNEAYSNYTQNEVVMNMSSQRASCSEGQLVSAILYVAGFGTLAKLGIRLRGWWDGKVNDDRAFEEGPPIQLKAATTHYLWVQGTVPEHTDQFSVEVYRDTDIKWDDAASGFQFDKFAMFYGRRESWFDGNSTDSLDQNYSWQGAPNTSRSNHWWANHDESSDWPTEYRDRMSPYYGLVEQLEDSRAKTRTGMEAEALTRVRQSFPTPVVVNVPQAAPLTATAPVLMSELVAGTTVPVQTTATCRQARADTSLTEVNGFWDSSGERVTVTLTGGKVWLIDDIAADDVGPDFVADDPSVLEMRSALDTGGLDGG